MAGVGGFAVIIMFNFNMELGWVGLSQYVFRKISKYKVAHSPIAFQILSNVDSALPTLTDIYLASSGFTAEAKMWVLLTGVPFWLY